MGPWLRPLSGLLGASASEQVSLDPADLLHNKACQGREGRVLIRRLGHSQRFMRSLGKY